MLDRSGALTVIEAVELNVNGSLLVEDTLAVLVSVPATVVGPLTCITTELQQPGGEGSLLNKYLTWFGTRYKNQIRLKNSRYE
jgi:hypothetical protein